MNSAARTLGGIERERLIRTPAAHFVFTTVLFTAVLLLALFLRLHQLDAKSLWIDEAYTHLVARGSLRALWANLFSDHVPGYFALMWMSVRLIGASEWAFRAPSAIAGVLALIAIWAIGREVGRSRAGALAAFMGAILPFGVYWSQEAKPQALWMAIAAWSSFFLLAAWRRRRRELWIAYWMLSVAGTYTFYIHLVLLAAQTGAVVVSARHRHGWRTVVIWLATQATLLFALLPWLVSHFGRAVRDVASWSTLENDLWVSGRLSLFRRSCFF